MALGDTGVVTALREALTFESSTCRRLRDLALLGIVLAIGHWLWMKRHRRALEDYDQSCPPAHATPQYCERLSVEKYEFQKMENTRLSLEKLTASDEYKRHEAKKLDIRKKATSKSMIVDGGELSSDGEEQHSGDEVGPAAQSDLRHNMTMIHETGGLDDEDESALALSGSTGRKKPVKRRQPKDGLGLIKHRAPKANK